MRDYYDITSEGTGDVVSLADAKLFLRVDSDITDDDNLIAALVQSSINIGQSITKRDFVQNTYEGFFEDLCINNFVQAPFIEIRRSPLVSVDSVSYMSGGAWSVVDTADYQIQRRAGFSRILFFNSPNPDTDTAWKFKVDFVAGYDPSTDLPDAIKTAVKDHVNFMYENRGDVEAVGGVGLPMVAKTLYKQFIINVGF